jgi:NTE family protein
MAQKKRKKREKSEEIVLVLQGGGALGAYQAGAFEALAAEGFTPSWIAGISIGAINGAIIAGNAPEARVDKLKSFWERVSSDLRGLPLTADGRHRSIFNDTSALLSLSLGVPGFFAPRATPPIFSPADAPEGVSYYSTAPLIATLSEHVDFDYLNKHGPRLAVGAVNVKDGNFAYFDKLKEPIRIEHVMASGALPPGLPPVRIGTDYFWDGGLVSNTPLQYVLDEPVTADALDIFQVDLFSASGTLPATLLDAVEREKEIRYSSRTRLNTDMMAKRHEMRCALKRLLAKLPKTLRNDPDAIRLANDGADPNITLVHLIYRERAYETHARDYEFSRISVEEHWEQGHKDAMKALATAEWRERAKRGGGITIVDPGRKTKHYPGCGDIS